MQVCQKPPDPALETTTLLPNPQFGDGENLTDEVQVKRAMDGTLYTYVKTKNGRRKLQWAFRLTRNKALELRAFIQAYYAKKIRVTDHNERVWVGNLMNNPFEFDTSGRAADVEPLADRHQPDSGKRGRQAHEGGLVVQR